MRLKYSSNNSGGEWWVSDEGWRALEANGWTVEWFTTSKFSDVLEPDKDGRWLGALAKNAFKDGFSSWKEALDEWERLTGCDALSAGCPCCGPPHSFSFIDDNGKVLESGPHVEYYAEW